MKPPIDPAIPPELDIVRLSQSYQGRVISTGEALTLSHDRGTKIIWHPDNQPCCILLEESGLPGGLTL